MTGITRIRYEDIRATAAHLLTQAGGVTFLDNFAFRQAALIRLAHDLAQAESVTYETARRHIARACRRTRHPDYRPPQWGGDHRTGSIDDANNRPRSD